MTETTPQAALYAALADARDRANPVAKTGYNDHHRYKYAPAERVIREARECLAGSGIAVVPVDSDTKEVAGQLVFREEYRVTHRDGGEIPGAKSWVVPTKSPTGKPLDVPKEVAKVATTAFAYYLRDLLMLERPPEDDINRPQPAMDHAAPAVSTGLSAKGRAALAKLERGGDRAKAAAFVSSLADRFSATDDDVVDGFTRADLDALMEATS